MIHDLLPIALVSYHAPGATFHYHQARCACGWAGAPVLTVEEACAQHRYHVAHVEGRLPIEPPPVGPNLGVMTEGAPSGGAAL